MAKVFLREKKLKNGRRGLYLDFYPPIKIPGLQKQTRREHLELYIFERAKLETEKEHNKETKMLGENIRAQRQLEVQAGVYNFISARSKQHDFLTFFREVIESRQQLSASTRYIWKAALYQLEDFTDQKCTFADVTETFCEDFKKHLLKNLAVNSAASYFIKFKSVLRAAAKNKHFADNPAADVKGVEREEVHKEFLTLEELQKLAAIPFKYEDLRRGVLSSSIL